jgi:hypothetical protein
MSLPVSDIPAVIHPEDRIIRAEELACIREHLAALTALQRPLDERMHALVAECRATPTGSPAWWELQSESHTLCAARARLQQRRRYWVDAYRAGQRHG